MGAMFPWPRTEDEQVEHMHTRHGMAIASLAEWRSTWPNRMLPSSAHQTMHTHESYKVVDHRHSEYGRIR